MEEGRHVWREGLRRGGSEALLYGRDLRPVGLIILMGIMPTLRS